MNPELVGVGRRRLVHEELVAVLVRVEVVAVLRKIGAVEEDRDLARVLTIRNRA